jgi:hypothetical protein
MKVLYEPVVDVPTDEPIKIFPEPVAEAPAELPIYVFNVPVVFVAPAPEPNAVLPVTIVMPSKA